MMKTPTLKDIENLSGISSWYYVKRWGSYTNFLKSIGETPNTNYFNDRIYTKKEVEDIFKKYIDEIHEKCDLEPISKNKIRRELGKNFPYFIRKYYKGIKNILFKLDYIPKLKSGSIPTLKQLDLNFDNVVKKLNRIPVYTELADKNISKLGVNHYDFYFGTWNGYLKYRDLKLNKILKKWSKQDTINRYFKLKNEISEGNSIPSAQLLRKKDQQLGRNITKYFGSFNNFLKEIEQIKQICEHCKKEFNYKNYYPKQKYCSLKCKYDSIQIRKRSTTFSLIQESKCPNCNNSLEYDWNKRNFRKFCSSSCRIKYHHDKYHQRHRQKSNKK